MLKVDAGILIITKNQKRLKIKGIKPSFQNQGNTPVRFMQNTLQPGEIGFLNYGDYEVETEIDIQFLIDSKPVGSIINKLKIDYGIVKKC